jgi:hypothetical protein
MLPSQIRETILERHRRLVPLLDAAEEAAERAIVGEASEAELRARMEELERAYRDLVEEERALLRPELEEVDAWGGERAAALDRVHLRQRLRLARTRQVSEEGGIAPRQLARKVIRTVEAIRAELQRHERRFLSPDLLRDDLVVVAQSDG